MSGSTIYPDFIYRPAKAALLGACLLLLGAFNQTARAQFGDLVAFTSPGNTAYYLDPHTGNDENTGTRPDAAWKTLSRINSTRFAPGDTIYIMAGTVYHGRLFPKGSGIPGRPITIDSFGDGARPAIHADGKLGAALLLENVNAWHVSHLELTNHADQPEAFRFGISILAEDTGSVGDFKLTNLYIHDVAGEANPGFGEGAAITFRNRGDRVPSSFDGILIERCIIENVQRHGISIDSGYVDQPRRPSNANVVIRSNTITNVAGDGIQLTGCDRAMIEYNTVRQAGQSRQGEVGGVALRYSDHCMVQFNDVAQTAGLSSAALRCGPNARENTFQFNFTHDSAGAMFAAIALPHERVPIGDASNVESTCRYNISQNDRTAFLLVGPVRDTRLYNNTIYTGPNTPSITLQLKRPNTAAHDARNPPESPGPTGVILANNLFYTRARASLRLGGIQADITCQTNAYFGDHQIPDQEPAPITADPLLADPGQAELIEQGVNGYQLLVGSPLIGSGSRLADHGRYDFWADPIPAGAAIDIGAYQHTSDNGPPADPPVDSPAESAPDR